MAAKRKKARKRAKRLSKKQLRRKNRPSAYWISKLGKNELPLRYSFMLVAITAVLSAFAAPALGDLRLRLPVTLLYLIVSFGAAFIAVGEKKYRGIRVGGIGVKIGFFTLFLNTLLDVLFIGSSPRMVESVYAFIGASAGGWLGEKEAE